MSEKSIVALFQNYRMWEGKCKILKDCADRKPTQKDLILEKRLAIANHMLAMLPEEEAIIVKLHLVDCLTWNKIADMQERGELPKTIGYDRRTMQRKQNRAILRLQKSLGGLKEEGLEALFDP